MLGWIVHKLQAACQLAEISAGIMITESGHVQRCWHFWFAPPTSAT